MPGTLDVYQRADRKWAWRLIAENGNIIATDGSQGYENKATCGLQAELVIGGEYKGARRTENGGPRGG